MNNADQKTPTGPDTVKMSFYAAGSPRKKQQLTLPAGSEPHNDITNSGLKSHCATDDQSGPRESGNWTRGAGTN